MNRFFYENGITYPPPENTIKNIDQCCTDIIAANVTLEVKQRFATYMQAQWNYHSNAVEGGSITWEEVQMMMNGHVKINLAKPAGDVMEMLGHIGLVHRLYQELPAINERNVKSMHREIIADPWYSSKDRQPGEFRRDDVYTWDQRGERVDFYPWPEVGNAMHHLMNWYRAKQERIDTNADPSKHIFDKIFGNRYLHPVMVAIEFHRRFEQIHPFLDGNGRLGRILMNIILMHNNYPPLIIDKLHFSEYCNLLGNAHQADTDPTENQAPYLNPYYNFMASQLLTSSIVMKRFYTMPRFNPQGPEISAFGWL